MENIDKIGCVKRYLGDVKKLNKKIVSLERQASYAKSHENQHDLALIEESLKLAKKKRDDAYWRIDNIDAVEGEILKNLYVFGLPEEEAADAVGYSVIRMYELARPGRSKLYEFIPEEYKA